MDADAVFGPAWAAIQHHHPELPACRFGFADGWDGSLASTHLPGSSSLDIILDQVGYRDWDKLTIEFNGSCLQHGISGTFETLLH